MSALVVLLGAGLFMMALVGLPLWAVYELSGWWHSKGPGRRRPDRGEPEVVGREEVFTCWECGTGPWGREWDPHRQSMTSAAKRARGLGLCPNCSGAD